MLGTNSFEAKYKFSMEDKTPFLNQPKKILVVDDQSFNIDAAMIILKYAVKIENADQVCDSA